jgi:CHAD domain-containing protein
MAALKVTSKEFGRRYREKAKELLDIASGLSDRPTPNEIHDLRVTGRRIQVMRRLLPRRSRMSHTSRRFDLLLKSVLKRTSQLRDLDTLMSTISEHKGSLPNGLLVSLGNQRSDAAASAKAACDVLAESPPPDVDPSEVKGRMLSKRLRKRARKRGREAAELLSEVLVDESRVDELHALRIEVKKLRYLLELSEKSPPELTVVTRWQESLGAVHDLDVAMRFLQGSDLELKGWAMDELHRSRHRSYLKFVSEARADSIEALESGGLLLRPSASQTA